MADAVGSGGAGSEIWETGDEEEDDEEDFVGATECETGGDATGEESDRRGIGNGGGALVMSSAGFVLSKGEELEGGLGGRVVVGTRTVEAVETVEEEAVEEEVEVEGTSLGEAEGKKASASLSRLLLLDSPLKWLSASRATDAFLCLNIAAVETSAFVASPFVASPIVASPSFSSVSPKCSAGGLLQRVPVPAPAPAPAPAPTSISTPVRARRWLNWQVLCAAATPVHQHRGRRRGPRLEEPPLLLSRRSRRHCRDGHALLHGHRRPVLRGRRDLERRHFCACNKGSVSGARGLPAAEESALGDGDLRGAAVPIGATAAVGGVGHAAGDEGGVRGGSGIGGWAGVAGVAGVACVAGGYLLAVLVGEKGTSPLLGPVDALADSAFGHGDVDLTRILHEEEHAAVGEED
ncbi:hypothetical protein BC938DRAFT_481786 [Jimgerdemannia flammicorona]|uniref:Uncharacterized protein n=1 Tax=Jimgerdemannia flammicorona TaxID=994334 RepID=A0A433QFJ4_9FUNG|nr:hypothetical protein BC938DRAFT_481786 [Jimgerdemannia flammicorona]